MVKQTIQIFARVKPTKNKAGVSFHKQETRLLSYCEWHVVAHLLFVGTINIILIDFKKDSKDFNKFVNKVLKEQRFPVLF